MAYKPYQELHEGLGRIERRDADTRTRELLREVLAAEGRKGRGSRLTFGAIIRAAEFVSGNICVTIRDSDHKQTLIEI